MDAINPLNWIAIVFSVLAIGFSIATVVITVASGMELRRLIRERNKTNEPK